MPTLNDMFKDTMLFVAAQGKGKEPEVFEGNGAIHEPAIPEKDISNSAAPHQAIWHWKIGKTPSIVERVSCIARGMGHARMLVCDKISFHDVIVNAGGKQSSALPLEDQFILKKFFINEGKINPFVAGSPRIGSHFLYPLEAEVDKSYLFVYGFDFPNGLDNKPTPIPESEWGDANFMPSPTHSNNRKVRPGQKMSVTLNVPRVVVFQSLVCCKERDDFDPGGLLGGGRMIPHLMVMVNQPAAHVFAKIGYHRPSNMTMLAHRHGSSHSHHNMNNKIENGLWADSNDPRSIFFVGPPSVFWDDLFDCYLVGNTFGIFKAVRPDKGKRTVKGAIEVCDRMVNFLGNKSYSKRDFERLPRQGAFDNIHIAPTMKETSKPPGPPYHADRVYMAPFCEHDCLHMHWRWSKAYTGESNRGWSPSKGSGIVPGEPYKVVGAPMVPENQFVDLRVTSLHSCEYRVHAKGATASSPSTPIPAGTYTFIHHHGSAYALSVNHAFFTGAKVFVEGEVFGRLEPSLTSSLVGEVVSSNSVYLYWHLRWGGVGSKLFGDKVMERIKITDAAKIRDA